MDDQFLERMRVEPSREFLASLKARLDSQTLASPVTPRRASVKTWLAALIIGAATLTAAALTFRTLPSLWRGTAARPDRVASETNSAHAYPLTKSET